VQVHDEPVERAEAGQRVAVNLVGVRLHEVGRGSVLASPAVELTATRILDCDLRLRGARTGERVHLHHGTREAPGRLTDLGSGLWQARLERPLIAAAGDRVVVRSVAPPDTLGGGVVLDPRARRHGRRADVIERLQRVRRGEPDEQAPAAAPAAQRPAPVAPALTPASLALESRLRAAGCEPPLDAQLGDDAAHLPALLAHGRAVRIGRAMHAHPDAIEAVQQRVTAIIDNEGAVTLARLRDELGTSRKYAQALLEHFDNTRVTLRLPDDRRVLRRRQSTRHGMPPRGPDRD
jgi:selenocysteine-specific elongation factor